MALKLEWTPEAITTFDQIISYLESHWSEREVSKFIERTEKALQLIAENPELYRRSESKSIMGLVKQQDLEFFLKLIFVAEANLRNFEKWISWCEDSKILKHYLLTEHTNTGS